MNVLNLYACLGGNRFLWSDEHDITAVELDPELARMYSERFPKDTVVVGDAHEYLLNHYREFDFIWTSPPCPTHSRARFWSSKGDTNVAVVYPDMKLYQEIILLRSFFAGKFCVENVVPYYEPLIPGRKRGRHLFWTNFPIPVVLSERSVAVGKSIDEVNKLCEFHKIDLSSYKGSQRKDKIARNLVDFEAGKTIFDAAEGIIRQQNTSQASLF